MKYYSEMTDKVYDSVDELNADEKRIHEEERRLMQKLRRRLTRSKELMTLILLIQRR